MWRAVQLCVKKQPVVQPGWAGGGGMACHTQTPAHSCLGVWCAKGAELAGEVKGVAHKLSPNLNVCHASCHHRDREHASFHWGNCTMAVVCSLQRRHEQQGSNGAAPVKGRNGPWGQPMAAPDHQAAISVAPNPGTAHAPTKAGNRRGAAGGSSGGVGVWGMGNGGLVMPGVGRRL